MAEAKRCLIRWGRILTLRAGFEDYASLGRTDLFLGLAATWLVGFGRRWDDPTSPILQKSGLGSVVYILGLALAMWVVGRALFPANWSFRHVITLIAYSSAPGLIYAVPWEELTSTEFARSANLWSLGIVATWRVAIYLRFLRVGGKLEWLSAITGTAFPLALVVLAVVAARLHGEVMESMMNTRRSQPTPSEDVKEIVFVLGAVAFYSFIPLLLMYARAIDIRRIHRNDGYEEGHIEP